MSVRPILCPVPAWNEVALVGIGMDGIHLTLPIAGLGALNLLKSAVENPFSGVQSFAFEASSSVSFKS